MSLTEIFSREIFLVLHNSKHFALPIDYDTPLCERSVKCTGTCNLVVTKEAIQTYSTLSDQLEVE